MNEMQKHSRNTHRDSASFSKGATGGPFHSMNHYSCERKIQVTCDEKYFTDSFDACTYLYLWKI